MAEGLNFKASKFHPILTPRHQSNKPLKNMLHRPLYTAIRQWSILNWQNLFTEYVNHCRLGQGNGNLRFHTNITSRYRNWKRTSSNTHPDASQIPSFLLISQFWIARP